MLVVSSKKSIAVLSMVPPTNVPTISSRCSTSVTSDTALEHELTLANAVDSGGRQHYKRMNGHFYGDAKIANDVKQSIKCSISREATLLKIVDAK